MSAKNFFANALNHITEERKKIAEERNRLTELDRYDVEDEPLIFTQCRSIGLREAEIKRKLENEQKISAVVEVFSFLSVQWRDADFIGAIEENGRDCEVECGW